MDRIYASSIALLDSIKPGSVIHVTNTYYDDSFSPVEKGTVLLIISSRQVYSHMVNFVAMSSASGQLVVSTFDRWNANSLLSVVLVPYEIASLKKKKERGRV